jgi:subtilisin family serine protease
VLNSDSIYDIIIYHLWKLAPVRALIIIFTFFLICSQEGEHEMKRSIIWRSLIACLLIVGVSVQAVADSDINKVALQNLARKIHNNQERRKPQLYYDLLQSTNPIQQALNRNPNIQLMYIQDGRLPVYYVLDNLIAAKTISTDRLWPGGGSGYNLTGSATTGNQLALWDGGGVLLTHQELIGRVVQMDTPSGTLEHSTHVAGTMIAAGINSNAKGMSYEARLSAYDFSDGDAVEMTTAAINGLRISNHSYGRVSGWYWDADSLVWVWLGDITISETEDYAFGFYDEDAQTWDEIARNATHYLIVNSAGNDRNDFGPGPGGGHYFWNGSDWEWSTTTRDPDGGADMYDCLPTHSTAKNILTVGAVNDILSGYSQPSDVVQTDFSSWGPADDGRIKPDIVANGAELFSCSNASNTSYRILSGTSMSAPSVAGSINLLADFFAQQRGVQPRSATMKAIVIHTADEAGPYNGPDYQNGWGLMNTKSAADLIAYEASPSFMKIREADLECEPGHCCTDKYYFMLDSSKDIRATLVWTDPPGTPPSPGLNPTDTMLVVDLALFLKHIPTSTSYFPWVLDGANPGDPAIKGFNAIDNVEVIDVENAPAGLYELAVGNCYYMEDNHQEYTLICSEEFKKIPKSGIPALSGWGLIALTMIFLALGAVLIAYRKKRGYQAL